MKLIDVEYLRESSRDIFFNVTIEFKSFFGNPKKITRVGYLTKCGDEGYSFWYRWVDNSECGQMDNSVVALMILQYEAFKNKS